MDSALSRLVIILYMALFTRRLSTHTLCDFVNVRGDIVIQFFSIYSNASRTKQHTVYRAHSSTSECSSLSALISTQKLRVALVFPKSLYPNQDPKNIFVLCSSSLTAVFASIWKTVLNICCLFPASGASVPFIAGQKSRRRIVIRITTFLTDLRLEPSPLFVDATMSKTTPTASSSFSPKLHAIFEAALKEYEKKTEISLLTHPLMVKLQECNSPADILVILRSQVAQSKQTTSADEKLTKWLHWLDPIVNVLSASSHVISACVGLVSPIQVIFLHFNLKSFV